MNKEILRAWRQVLQNLSTGLSGRCENLEETVAASPATHPCRCRFASWLVSGNLPGASCHISAVCFRRHADPSMDKTSLIYSSPGKAEKMSSSNDVPRPPAERPSLLLLMVSFISGTPLQKLPLHLRSQDTPASSYLGT